MSDPEFNALEAILDALAPLDSDARERVLGYFLARFGIDPRIFIRDRRP